MFKNSILKSKWNLPFYVGTSTELSEKLCVSETMARLLMGRGYDTFEKAKAFIGKEQGELCDPFLLADMGKAADRVIKGINAGEPIMVYGDYDADGVTSTTIVYKYLKNAGASVDYYIPDRVNEGYGVNSQAIKDIADRGYKLIITVDTGITACAEAELASSLGVDMVITDHHECGETLPDAVAVVDPHRSDCPYPFKKLAGVGVAYKLLCAVEERLRGVDMFTAVAKISEDFAAEVAIGTIADVMELVGENRLIVGYGLSRMSATTNKGLSALMCAAGIADRLSDGSCAPRKKITASTVGFTISPRINAAGRLASASDAVRLFVTDDEKEAEALAEKLCELNRLRQAEENRIIQQAREKIGVQCSEGDYVIVLDDDSWNHGVVGIVASRITGSYNLPSIIISFEGSSDGQQSDDDIGKGSGRSVKGFDLFDALHSLNYLLEKSGGHELAAGLSIKRENLDEFRRRINEYAAEKLRDTDLSKILNVDLIVRAEEITLNLAKELTLLEPYGGGNPQPVFALENAVIEDIVSISDGKHLRLILRSGQSTFTAMMFNTSAEGFIFSCGDRVDIIFNLEVNEFRGRENVSIIVCDIRSAEVSPVLDRRKPERQDFVVLYSYIRHLTANNEDTTYELLCSAIGNGADRHMIRVMIEIFIQLGIASFEENNDKLRLRLMDIGKKVSFEESELYRTMMGK